MSKRNKILIYTISIMYLVLLIYLLGWLPMLHKSWVHKLEWNEYVMKTTNLIPLKTIIEYILELLNGSINAEIVLQNLVINPILWVPFGFLISFFFNKKKSLVYSLCIVLLVEVLQCMFRIGFFDIDDIILRSVGILIGQTLYGLFDTIQVR